MLSFDRLSIRNKLIAITVVVSSLSVMLGSFVALYREIRLFREDMVTNTVTMARIVGDYAVTDLAFSDPSAAQKTLRRLSAVPHILSAYLFSPEGRTFASYTRAGERPDAPKLQQSLVRFTNEYLETFQPVNYQGQHYGTIYLRSSLEPLQERISTLIWSRVLIILSLVVVASLLAGMLQRVISKPILVLAKTARKISETQDYSMRVEKRRDDEIGQLYDGFNNMLMQIESRQHERDKAAEALQESEDRYRGLVESSPELIFVEQDGRIVYMNTPGLRLLGYGSVEELKKHSLLELVPTDKRPEVKKFIKQSCTGPGLLLETAFVRKDKKVLDVELACVSSVYRGASAIQGVARDITESKNLRVAAERMKRLSALGELSATIAHEIRNSLASILLNFRMLSEKLEIPADLRNTFANMELGIARIQNLIKGILDFARPSPPSFRTVSLQKIIDSSLHPLEKEFETSGIVIRKNYNAIDDDVWVDPNQIVQVLLNLLFNAKQAMPGGGQIRLTTVRKEGWIELAVEDTGKGIPEENLDRIFDPFFTTTREGVGLGLATVARILDQHQVPILVESKLSGGTTFTLRFSVNRNGPDKMNM